MGRINVLLAVVLAFALTGTTSSDCSASRVDRVGISTSSCPDSCLVVRQASIDVCNAAYEACVAAAGTDADVLAVCVSEQQICLYATELSYQECVVGCTPCISACAVSRQVSIDGCNSADYACRAGCGGDPDCEAVCDSSLAACLASAESTYQQCLVGCSPVPNRPSSWGQLKLIYR